MEINKKAVLKKYKHHYWHVADLELYEDFILKKTIRINKFYDITEDWFFIYDEIGGSGTGFWKGEIINKIYIGDSEFQKIEVE